MQKDFHYYGVFVLANLAGFSQDEAKTIAYASQYVDDSTDSKQIRIGDYVYDTVRTAHSGIRSFKWNVHKKIYFPFHFLPPEPVSGKEFSYVTQRDSPFANLVIDDAIADRSELRLYRIGIALHTFADTWAHQNFSGRKHIENDVRSIDCYEEDKWRALKRPWDFFLDLLRARVGHLQALEHPDYGFENFRYKNFEGREFFRQNPEEFSKAAQAVLKKLVCAKGTTRSDAILREHQTKIVSILGTPPKDAKNNLESRCAMWVSEYRELFKSKDGETSFQYDPNEWRDHALELAKEGDLTKFLQSDWVRFQRAALKQRYFVLERLM